MGGPAAEQYDQFGLVRPGFDVAQLD